MTRFVLNFFFHHFPVKYFLIGILGNNNVHIKVYFDKVKFDEMERRKVSFTFFERAFKIFIAGFHHFFFFTLKDYKSTLSTVDIWGELLLNCLSWNYWHMGKSQLIFKRDILINFVLQSCAFMLWEGGWIKKKFITFFLAFCNTSTIKIRTMNRTVIERVRKIMQILYVVPPAISNEQLSEWKGQEKYANFCLNSTIADQCH